MLPESDKGGRGADERRMRGTDESPRRLWERSSSERFVKEAKVEIHMATTIFQWEGERKIKKMDKPILGERSVSWLLERIREVTLEGSTPRGVARHSPEIEDNSR